MAALIAACDGLLHEDKAERIDEGAKALGKQGHKDGQLHVDSMKIIIIL